jgi:hexosaminidase
MKYNSVKIIIAAMGLMLLACRLSDKTISLAITWGVDKNYAQDESTVHDATFEIVNTGTVHLSSDNWSLYWNQAPHDIISHTGSDQLHVRRINGDFYEMKPTDQFSLAPLERISVTITCEGAMIKESDGPLGVYVMGENQNFIPIEDVTILPFSSADQVNRSSDDLEPTANPDYLHEAHNYLTVLPDDQLYPMIPMPKSVSREDSSYTFTDQLQVYYPDSLQQEVEYLTDGLKSAVRRVNDRSSVDIVLDIDPSLSQSEAYQLDINADGIMIKGIDQAAVFYGIVSLIKLYHDSDGVLPAMSILDYPAYAYRGMHVDVARNFQSKETMLRLLDVMAELKLNKLLLYITEDEGWRLAIEELPELTDVASRRGHTLTDEEFLQPAYGSGPDPDDPQSTGNGYYSRDEFKELISYAHDRHIDIIPEVNFPGHARAAIYAMEHRYHRLMAAGDEQGAEQYRLIDPDDQSIYKSAQSYHDNIVCVCRPSVYEFYATVLADIQEMYDEAGVPLTMIHTGGDEVPRGAWTASPMCESYLKQYSEITNIRNLQGHFFKNLVEQLKPTGLQIGGWEEVVMNFDQDDHWQINDAFTSDNVYPYIWNNLWGEQDLGYRIANTGYPVILCNVTNFYFDLAYDKDPREPGLYWAGFINEKDAFSFVPENLFISTQTDDMGYEFTPEVDFKDMERLQRSARSNIVGIQGQLWGETVKGRDMLEYYYLPKIYGLAQRAWEGTPPWSALTDATEREDALNQDYNRFINTIVQKEFRSLDQPDKIYHYRIPAPGIRIQDQVVSIVSPYPGMEIRYTTDGTEPTANSELYNEPFKTAETTIRAKIYNSLGRSGLESQSTIELKDYVK